MNKKERVTIFLKPDTKRAISKRAEIQEISRSSLINMIINNEIKKTQE